MKHRSNEAATETQHAWGFGQRGGEGDTRLSDHGRALAIVSMTGKAKLFVDYGSAFHLFCEMGVHLALLG